MGYGLGEDFGPEHLWDEYAEDYTDCKRVTASAIEKAYADFLPRLPDIWRSAKRLKDPLGPISPSNILPE